MRPLRQPRAGTSDPLAVRSAPLSWRRASIPTSMIPVPAQIAMLLYLLMPYIALAGVSRPGASQSRPRLEVQHWCDVGNGALPPMLGLYETSRARIVLVSAGPSWRDGVAQQAVY